MNFYCLFRHARNGSERYYECCIQYILLLFYIECYDHELIYFSDDGRTAQKFRADILFVYCSSRFPTQFSNEPDMSRVAHALSWRSGRIPRHSVVSLRHNGNNYREAEGLHRIYIYIYIYISEAK